MKEHVKSFAVWLFWATVQAVVGGIVGLFLVAMYLRAH